MKDKRLEVLAKNLINYSCELKAGEKILIEATDIDNALTEEIIKQVYKVKAFPFIGLYDYRVKRAMLMGTSKEHCGLMAKYDAYRMKEMDAYIGIRGGHNSFEISDVPDDLGVIYSKYYSHPVHHELRVKKSKWVVLRYPNPAFAQLMHMSTEKAEDFYFNVCNLDYSKMDKAMDPLKKLMDKTDKVKITGKGTDLEFSVKGIGSVKCSGKRNIPDGEIYTAPVKNSVNGIISYNCPTIENGVKHENIVLKFKDGKIIDAAGSDTKKLNKVLDTDEGARYIGEFALGVNPYILSHSGDILFDEKIKGSFHFTPGSCYDDANNGNKSAVHWDMVMLQSKPYGGKIFFDGKLVRENGLFVLPELKALNDLK